MQIEHYNNPVTFCVIKNFYPEDVRKSILKELNEIKPNLRPPHETGSASNFAGDKKKDNRGLFLDQFYGPNRNKSPILTANRKVFAEVAWELKKENWFYKYLETCNQDSTLISYYQSGDYYEPHSDQGIITAIYYIWEEPKNFEGGDIYLEDFKVPIENNCMLIFPSCTTHHVTRVSGTGRWAISQFINCTDPPRPPPVFTFPNCFSTYDFCKIREHVFNQNAKWELKGGSILSEPPSFWFMDLIDNDYFSGYLKDQIEIITGRKFKLNRTYANGQFHGQDGKFHTDDLNPTAWTFLLYTNVIGDHEIDTWGGATEFKTENGLMSQQPYTNLGVLFKSNTFHRGLAPSRFTKDLRVTIAWKLEEWIS
jgi:hypothetical protein